MANINIGYLLKKRNVQFNNRNIGYKTISEFRSICEEELGFEDKDYIKCVIQILAHNNDIVKEIIKNIEK